MVHKINVPDYIGDYAASQRLAEVIRTYHARRGRRVDVRVEEHPGPNGIRYYIRSNLVAGVPDSKKAFVTGALLPAWGVR
jgi:hypothetical protein